MKNIALASFLIIFTLFTSNNVSVCGYLGRVDGLTQAVTTDFNLATIVFSGTLTAVKYVLVRTAASNPKE